jgi:hypothetical protein
VNPPSNFYTDWRVRAGCASTLREGASAPPEKLLQAIWQHQRLRRGALVMADGRALRVLHPGFCNFEAGPDFRGAVVQFGDEPPRAGDVEIDLQLSGWRAHGHDVNPNFKNVLLHVVWENTRANLPLGVPPSGDSGRTESAEPNRLKAELPTLSLQNLLDAPLAELDAWLGGESAESLPETFRGRCCAPLRELSGESLLALLRQAALVRLRGKAAWFAARARHEGWEQALWEGLFRALGYKQNVWPMLRLAELRGALGAGKKLSPLEWQARLLGAGGLLPDELTRAQSSTDDFLKRVWDLWWRERDKFAEVTLPRAVWKFNGLRPANHPTRRLALAAHWLARGDLVARVERWSSVKIDVTAAGATHTAALHSLLEIFQIERDEFWSWHWTLKSARMKKPQPLLGATRVTDLGINVVLPWLWARANEGRNEKFLRALEQNYFAWPAAEDNAVLKLARQRLLGGAGRGVFATAAAQQGLLQVVRDFCEHSNAVCEACRFPDLVRTWQQPNSV